MKINLRPAQRGDAGQSRIELIRGVNVRTVVEPTKQVTLLRDPETAVER